MIICQKNKQAYLKDSGFTIVELLIVIVVIGILAAIALVAYNGVQGRAIDASLQSDLSNAARQLQLDMVANGTYPATLAAASDGKGVKGSGNNLLQYTVNNSSNPPSFCLTAANKGRAFRIDSSASSAPVSGTCPGHNDGSSVALSCESGYVPVPGNSMFGTSDFCVMKYEAKDVSGAVSVPDNAPRTNINQADAVSAAQAACSSCHLITEAEWLTIAHNVLNQPANWTSGTVGSGQLYRGHSDNSPNNTLAASSDDSDGFYGVGSGVGRRTLYLSNGEVIWDFSGNVWEWTSGQITSNLPGGPGLAWREWNSLSDPGGANPNPIPGYGSPALADRTGSEGLGRLFSDADSTGITRGFIRGGDRHASYNGGVFALTLNGQPSFSGSDTGFRVTHN